MFSLLLFLLLPVSLPASYFFNTKTVSNQVLSAKISSRTSIQNIKPTSPPKPTISIKTLLNTPTSSPTQTKQNSSIPTSLPTQTPTPIQAIQKTPTPTIIYPTPTPAQTSSSPTPTPSPTSSGNVSLDSVQSYIMNAINEYRRSEGLSEVKPDPYTCGFAKTRASEIVSNFSHDGFRSRIDTKTLPYLSYSYITENIAMNSDYKNVVNAWIASSGHAENMRKDTPHVCVAYDGKYYAYEGWKP